MRMSKFSLTEEQLRSFQYFLENDNLSSWVDWDSLVVRLTVHFPDLDWYFTYKKKVEEVKIEILQQVDSFLRENYE